MRQESATELRLRNLDDIPKSKDDSGGNGRNRVIKKESTLMMHDTQSIVNEKRFKLPSSMPESKKNENRRGSATQANSPKKSINEELGVVSPVTKISIIGTHRSGQKQNGAPTARGGLSTRRNRETHADLKFKSFQPFSDGRTNADEKRKEMTTFKKRKQTV